MNQCSLVPRPVLPTIEEHTVAELSDNKDRVMKNQELLCPLTVPLTNCYVFFL